MARPLAFASLSLTRLSGWQGEGLGVRASPSYQPSIKNLMKHFNLRSLTLLSLFTLCALPLSAQNEPDTPTLVPPDLPTLSAPELDHTSDKERGEMRGLWVVRDSLRSPKAIRNVVETAVKYHFNALFVQVRGRGDAFYQSVYEPRAEILAGQPALFDPLATMVVEAHAKGLQVHAWMNTYLTWSGSRPPRSKQHLWNAHRSWFTQDTKGKCSCVPNDKCEGGFLQPSNPAVQDHLFRVFTDVASRYDVDGIHFDYCRYANSEHDFSPGTLSRFRLARQAQLSPDQFEKIDLRRAKDPKAFVHAYPNEWGEWRRAQVTALVTRISEAVKAEKPFMEVSAAVFADGYDAFKYRGQEWENWLKSGVIDAVALMSYDKNTERVLAQTRRAVEIAGERHVYTGIGAWRLGAADVAHKIAKVRETGAAGVNLFSYDGVHTRPEYLATLSRGVFSSRAGTPRMRWLPPRKSVDKGNK